MRFVILVGVALAMAGCTRPEGSAKTTQLANPASEHCVKVGGRVEIRQETAGAVGYCHLPDGQVVEEWALFRRSTSGADATKN